MTEKLETALLSWFASPINDHGTPYVPCPNDFTPDEQQLFVDLVREPRLVPREEQVAKIRSIIRARPRASYRIETTDAEMTYVSHRISGMTRAEVDQLAATFATINDVRTEVHEGADAGPEIVALSEAEVASFMTDSNWGED